MKEGGGLVTLTDQLTEMVVANGLDLVRLEILEEVIQVGCKLLIKMRKHTNQSTEPWLVCFFPLLDTP